MKMKYLGLSIVMLAMLLTTTRLMSQEPLPTVAEAEATTPGVPPAPVPPSETLTWVFALSIVANGLMKMLKDAPWFPWIKAKGGTFNLAIAAVLALGTSLGIHTEFDQAAGTLLVTGLSFGAVFHFAGEWIKQFAIQQFTYQSMRDTTRNV